jgi:hypothetical protein
MANRALIDLAAWQAGPGGAPGLGPDRDDVTPRSEAGLDDSSSPGEMAASPFVCQEREGDLA